jgi:hypothetical protein
MMSSRQSQFGATPTTLRLFDANAVEDWRIAKSKQDKNVSAGTDERGHLFSCRHI